MYESVSTGCVLVLLYIWYRTEQDAQKRIRDLEERLKQAERELRERRDEAAA